MSQAYDDDDDDDDYDDACGLTRFPTLVSSPQVLTEPDLQATVIQAIGKLLLTLDPRELHGSLVPITHSLLSLWQPLTLGA